MKSLVRSNKITTLTIEIDIFDKEHDHVNSRFINKNKDLLAGTRESDQLNRQCKSCVEERVCQKIHLKMESRKLSKVHGFDWFNKSIIVL